MKFFYFSLFIWCGSFTPTHPLFVRVLLDEASQKSWKIDNTQGIRVRDGSTKAEIPLKKVFSHFTVSVDRGKLYLNSCPFERTKLWIEPLGKAPCAVDGQYYDGRLLIVRHKGQWYLLSVVELEEYVFSVLKTESWPGWPLEAQKVLAVASRSYVLYQLLQAREKKLPYHIRNTNAHQTYTGLHTCPVIRQAVQETAGMFLAYQNKPILAMFDCCCGGVIPAKTANLADFVKAPYLKRDYACTYCQNSKVYSWTVSYTLDKVQRLVQEHHDAIVHDIKDISIQHKDAAGLVHHVVVKTKKNSFTLSSQRLYKALKNFKSRCYSFVKKGRTIVVNGRGYGHHLGLCQWGAKTMVDQGWEHKDVLLYYYPGTYFMQVSDKDTIA